MIRIGIDQSITSTGLVALDDHDAVIGHKLIKTTPREFPCLHHRLSYISTEVVNWMVHVGATCGTIEGLSYGSVGRATRDLAGVYFLIHNKVFEKCGIKLDVVTPTSLKKFATGTGAAKKPAMVAALPDHVRVMFEELEVGKSIYDLADAYWLSKTMSNT